MSEQFWSEIRRAIEQVENGHARRVEIERRESKSKVTVYTIGSNVIRCDIKYSDTDKTDAGNVGAAGS